MGLETGNFIADLNPANPQPEDGKDQGDDHIRLVKAVLQNSISGFAGAVLLGGQDTGVSNAYVLASPLRAYSVNLTVLWLPANTNGGASTINIAGLGAQPIRRIDGTPLENGDIMAGAPVAMVYNGTQFRLMAVTKRYVDNLITSGVLPGQTGNAGKPLITDGTNAAFSNAFGVAMDEAEGAPIAASSTLNLTSAAGTGNFTHITGSGFTINLMTLPGGAARDLVFDGTGTLTNGANLILPTNANIAVQAGDTLRVRGEGAGVARVVSYDRASGRPLVEQLPPGLLPLVTFAPTAGVSVLDFLNVFSGTYDDYVVRCRGLSVQGAQATIDVRVAQLSVVDIGANYMGGQDNAVISNNSDRMAGVATLPSTSSGTVGADLTMNFHAANSNFQTMDAASIYAQFGATGYSQTTRFAHFFGPISGFRMLLNGGTFAGTGLITIYGIRKG